MEPQQLMTGQSAQLWSRRGAAWNDVCSVWEWLLYCASVPVRQLRGWKGWWCTPAQPEAGSYSWEVGLPESWGRRNSPLRWWWCWWNLSCLQGKGLGWYRQHDFGNTNICCCKTVRNSYVGTLVTYVGFQSCLFNIIRSICYWAISEKVVNEYFVVVFSFQIKLFL